MGYLHLRICLTRCIRDLMKTRLGTLLRGYLISHLILVGLVTDRLEFLIKPTQEIHFNPPPVFRLATGAIFQEAIQIPLGSPFHQSVHYLPAALGSQALGTPTSSSVPPGTQ